MQFEGTNRLTKEHEALFGSEMQAKDDQTAWSDVFKNSNTFYFQQVFTIQQKLLNEPEQDEKESEASKTSDKTKDDQDHQKTNSKKPPEKKDSVMSEGSQTDDQSKNLKKSTTSEDVTENTQDP